MAAAQAGEPNAWSIRRMRRAFAPFSGLVTMAGIAMMIVFGTKYVQHRDTLDAASPASATPALVTRVTGMTCTTSARTSIQTFNVRQRCLEVYVDMGAPAPPESRRIVVLESDAGRLAAGDQVYVLASPTAVGGALIIHAHDATGFFLRQYSSAAMALLGALLLAGSFALKRGLGDEPTPDVGGR